MKCQNCGFEISDRICSVCGAEVAEIKEENLKTVQDICDSDDNKDTEDVKAEKPKIRIRKILLLILIIVLSAAIVSVSSIAIFYFSTYDNRTSFSKINQTVNCGDFSITLKEAKTPEFDLEYFPRIVYDLVFEIHNNTGSELTVEVPNVAGYMIGKGEKGGYLLIDPYFYKANGKKDLSVKRVLSAWSDEEFCVRVYYENYEDDIILYESGVDSLAPSDIIDTEDDEIDINSRKIKYKKESLQRYKDNSPESFYLILSSKNLLSDEEDQYARFFVEPDKEAIAIPEGENIE